MPNIEQKHFAAAGAMAEVFTTKLGTNRAVHPPTVIAAGARMAGTLLLRSFGFDTSKMQPGSAVLSEQANEKGPELINILGNMLTHYGVPLDKAKFETAGRGEEPKLTVNAMQELLEPDLTAVRERFGLDLVGGAHACALTTAWLVKECAPQIGAEVGFNIAVYGFIEGSKTVPIPLPSTPKKAAWYQFWRN
jgi:hypothetical protein